MEMKSYQYFLVHSENEKKNKKSNICPLIALKLSLVLMMDWIILAFYDVLNFCSNFRENSLFGSLIASLFYSFCSCLGALVYEPCTLVGFLIGALNIFICLLIKKAVVSKDKQIDSPLIIF